MRRVGDGHVVEPGEERLPGVAIGLFPGTRERGGEEIGKREESTA